MENLQFMTGLLERKKKSLPASIFSRKMELLRFHGVFPAGGTEGEITVNPYAFFSRCLYIMEQKDERACPYRRGPARRWGNTAGREDLAAGWSTG